MKVIKKCVAAAAAAALTLTSTAGSTCGNGAGGRWCGSDGPAGTLERVNVQ